MHTPIDIRKIIHVDMDAFYASVAQLDDPSLVGKAIAVGGGGKRGVVSAASYQARKFGVRSAMAGALALKLCPHLIFVKTDFDRYKEISDKVRSIFFEYTDLVEPLSLDEAYLDVTHNKKGNPSATLIAKEIRDKIYQKTGLSASAGISINKFVAKIAKISLESRVPNITSGATYYHANFVRPKWSKAFKRTATIGKHHFYRG